jgi:hypothetical protein
LRIRRDSFEGFLLTAASHFDDRSNRIRLYVSSHGRVVVAHPVLMQSRGPLKDLTWEAQVVREGAGALRIAVRGVGPGDPRTTSTFARCRQGVTWRGVVQVIGVHRVHRDGGAARLQGGYRDVPEPHGLFDESSGAVVLALKVAAFVVTV